MQPSIAPHLLSRRSFRFWVLVIGLLIPTVYGWIRLGYTFINWHWLIFAGIVPSPLYLAISGGVWGLVGVAGLIWLWGRFNWHRIVVSMVALFFALTYWIDRLVVRAIASTPVAESSTTTANGGVTANGSLAINSSLSGNAPFAVFFTLLCLIFVVSALLPWEELKGFSRKQE